MKYDMIVSDFDWTLGCAPGIIEEDTVKAIKDYVSHGGIFVICTGRMYRAIRPICDKYGIDGKVVCYQGCLIQDINGGGKILDEGLSPSAALDIVDKFREEKVQMFVDIDDELYYETTSDYLRRYEELISYTGKLVPDVKEIIKAHNRPVQKVCALCDEETNKRIRDKYNARYNGEVLFNSGAKYLVEAINPQYDKGHAVKFMAKYYGIPFSKILTVGDSTNDVPLISGEWYGVAVGDGAEEAKKAAKEITVPFSAQPVKTLIEKYGR